jgi:hypothetical protein
MELASVMGTVSTNQLQFVPIVGSIPTSYHILNFTLNSLIMELVVYTSRPELRWLR